MLLKHLETRRRMQRDVKGERDAREIDQTWIPFPALPLSGYRDLEGHDLSEPHILNLENLNVNTYLLCSWKGKK